MRTPGSSLSASFAALVALALVGPARAQAPSDKSAQAEVLFRDARDLMARGDLEKACPKFRASHELDPGYGSVWNLAECLAKQGKKASAWAAYVEAADIARRADQAERVEKAERRAAELSPQLERLAVSVAREVAGLAVKRDGVAVDRAAWGSAFPVDPGLHVIEAGAPGKKAWRAEVSTKGAGVTVTVEVPALEDLPPAPPPPRVALPVVPPPPPPPDPAAAARRTAGFVVGSAGVAAMAVGAVLGGLAASKWSSAQGDHCRTETKCDARGVALAADAKTFASASTGLFVGGGVAAAAGVTLLVTGLVGDKRRTGLSISPGPGAVGLALEARF